MTTDSMAATEVDSEEAAGTQYLTFLLADEQYGLNILQVQEIRGWEQVTRIPNAPHYVQGVINLRGTIVPVLDLRLRFHMTAAEYTKETVVIVVRSTDADGGERSVGMVVDAVSDVYSIPEEDLKPVPRSGNAAVMESVRSLATVNEKLVILLDIDHLLNSEDLAVLDGVTV